MPEQGDQFRFMVHEEGSLYSVNAFAEPSGAAVGRLGLSRWPLSPSRERGLSPDHAAETGQMVQSQKKERGGHAIRTAFVHPDYQRRGIASHMLNVAAVHHGSFPVHDTSMSEAAQSWAASMGGAANKIHPEMQTGDSYVHHETAGIVGNYPSRDELTKRNGRAVVDKGIRTLRAKRSTPPAVEQGRLF